MAEEVLKLDPVDAAFLEKITRRVTNSNALPFEIPQSYMPDIINRALAKAYELDSYATENKWLAIPAQEISKARNSSGNFNAELKLPESVAAIMQLYSTQGAIALGIGSSEFVRAVIFQTYSTNYRAYGYQSEAANSLNYRAGYGRDHPTVSSNIVALFEYSMYKSALTKGIRFAYNHNTNTLNVQGQHGNASIILDCFVKIDKADLYKNIFFQDYVTGLTMQALADITMSFDFQLPGKVKINFDRIADKGEKLVDKTEEYWKENQSNDFIFYT